MTGEHANDNLAYGPFSTIRLVPSCFPPIGLFDTVTTPADLTLVMELEGWTNDRLLPSRLARLPEDEWVFGRPNSSIVMAAFLHVGPNGMRFNSPDLGAWYAAKILNTAITEVGHHLRREAVATNKPSLTRNYRCYLADLEGGYFDIRGRQADHPDLYASDSYAVSQKFGEEMRAINDQAGILFDSLRHRGGENFVTYRPRMVANVVQGDHYALEVQAAGRRMTATKLS